MSIVRIGMSEDSKFGDGYEAIFGKKTSSSGKTAKKPTAKKPTAKKAVAAAKKPAARKTAKKK